MSKHVVKTMEKYFDSMHLFLTNTVQRQYLDTQVGAIFNLCPETCGFAISKQFDFNFFFAVSTSFGNSTESKLLVFVMKMQRKCLTRIKVKSSALTGTLATRTME